MSHSKTLRQKIFEHLTQADESPVGKLSSDLLKMRDNRLTEEVTIKAIDGEVNKNELVKHLQRKGLTLDDVRDSDGYISIEKLKSHKITVS